MNGDFAGLTFGLPAIRQTGGQGENNMTDLNMMDLHAKMRHQDLINEANREALAAQFDRKGTSLFAQIAVALKAVLRRKALRAETRAVAG
jgi:hypothetical protein